MKVPRYIERAIARKDPWLRIEFDPRQGAWLLIRLHGAPARGRQTFMPPNRLRKICDGMYDMKQAGELVLKITGRDGKFIDIEEAFTPIMRFLYEADSWERNIRSGEKQIEREDRDREKYEAEDEAETMDAAKSLGKLTDPWIDMGAKENIHSRGREHRRAVREGRI